ncbi:MAG: hypothetical protein J6C64_04615 [Lachnospiraceae bacterium]|nr:hypothetical protein [Lachnospiraceae bacterium]
MEYIIFAAVMLGFVLILMIKGYFDYRKEEKNFIRKLYTDYGILPQREYKTEQFANISHYYEKHKGSFYIDDITWNDLNMDEVFKKLNYTFSAAGEEYLYYTLRTPFSDKKILEKREEIIDYFRTHADERAGCQFLFAKLGRTGKFSIYDYLDYLDGLGERKNFRHYAALAAALASIAVMFLNLPIGLLLLVGVFIYNILSYFKIKNEIDPYIVSFSYIFRLTDMTDKLCRKKIPVLKEELDCLKKASEGLNGFKRGSYILMSAQRMSGSGNPLEIFLDYFRMIFHLDLIKFNNMLSEVRKHIHDIDKMLTIAGEIETMIAIGAFREGNADFCIPEFTDEKIISGKNIYHPLIREPVKNDIFTEKSVLITGSNASGKSTFLKTIAVNNILAQTIHTCMADSYLTGMFRICSSMTLRDDIQGGDSYYMVEIKALKRIMDELKKDGIPVLCFVDEVLRGTNTVERIAASAQILKSLSGDNCLCFAATHDIELTHILQQDYKNYHFEENIEDNDILFSYKIMDGRAATRNAIKLLGIMGYDEEIVEKAENMAAEFMVKGSWEALGN